MLPVICEKHALLNRFTCVNYFPPFFSDYIEQASEADLGIILIKALPTDKARVIRERIYHLLLEGLKDSEIDELQNFYNGIVPKYFKTCIPAEGQFRVMTAIANDLGINILNFFLVSLLGFYTV